MWEPLLFELLKANREESYRRPGWTVRRARPVGRGNAVRRVLAGRLAALAAVIHADAARSAVLAPPPPGALRSLERSW